MADITFEPSTDIGREPVRPTVQASLAERLTRLRRSSGFKVTDRTLLVAGSVLLPLGFLFVVLGWYGAAHTTRLFEEIPYLISGGLLGITLAVAGGFCYFGYFLARLLATSREMLDAMLRIEERLDAVPSGVAPIAAMVPVFVATRTGAMYHRGGCSVVANRPVAELRAVAADGEGMTPCRICLPAPERLSSR